MLNSTKTWQEEKLNELVRDLCSVEFRVKSATRKRLEQFISDLISQTREETIREEIKYWHNVFDNRPKDRDLESDNIAQNFARIEIERLENKLK
jgi:hypothetical protein